MTNLAVAALTFVALVVVVLLVARLGKTYLFALSMSFILMSNITVQMSAELLPGVTISWAIVIYSLVYLITDLVIEFYGRRTAFELAAANLVIQVVLWAYVWLSLKVTPSASGNSHQVYETMKALFGTTTQITIAAILAAVGPFTDIFVTSKIRGFLARHRIVGNEIINLIARAKLSTFLGEIINTVIFFGIALIGTNTPREVVVSIVISATIAKWVISAADAPFLWLYFKYSGAPSDAHENLRGRTVAAQIAK